MRRGRSSNGRGRARSGRGRFELLYGRAAFHAGALTLSGAAAPHDASSSLDAQLTAARLEVWPDQPHHELSTDFYSLFLETEINFGGEGGLLADQIWNGDLEALGRGDWSQPSEAQASANPGSGRAASHGLPHQRLSSEEGAKVTDLAEPPPDQSDFRPWSSLGGATLEVVREGSGANPHALRISGGRDGAAGASNPGYWGIGLRAGVEQRLRLRAKSAGGGASAALRVQLLDGREVVAEAVLQPTGGRGGDGSGWRWLEATLRPTRAARAASLGLLLEPSAAGGGAAVVLDHVSLVPADAVDGLYRRDIFEALKALRPGFVRFPGGDFLEGTGPRTRWEWKRTVGPPEERGGHFNSAWGYWVRDRLGLFELLQLSERLGAAPLLAIPTGLQLDRAHFGHARYGPPPRNSSWAQEALDAIAFATDAADAANVVGIDAAAAAAGGGGNARGGGSRWGALRASMGRAAPFRLTKVEVGNEERTDSHAADPDTGYAGTTRGDEAEGEVADRDGGYAGRYRAVTEAVLARHPRLEVIASGRWMGDRQDVSASPCLAGGGGGGDGGGARCDLWDEHFYRSPDEMVSNLLTRYDEGSYDRATRPKVFVGEYAAPAGCCPPVADSNTMRAAVAEAAFALSMERNADVVKATAFAPLLANVHGTQWHHVLLRFDQTRLVRTPSYHALALLRGGLGTHTLRHARSGGAPTWEAAASRLGGWTDAGGGGGGGGDGGSGGGGGVISVKLANYHPAEQQVTVALRGHDAAPPVLVAANATTLTADSPDAINRLGDEAKGEPLVVEPAAPRDLPLRVDGGGDSVRVTMPAWSVTVVRIVVDQRRG